MEKRKFQHDKLLNNKKKLIRENVTNKKKVEKEVMLEKIRGIKKSPITPKIKATSKLDDFNDKYSKYLNEKKKKKDERQTQKPIFKFYHVDNKNGIHFKFEAKDVQTVQKISKRNMINPYGHIKAKVDTGLKRKKQELDMDNKPIKIENTFPIENLTKAKQLDSLKRNGKLNTPRKRGKELDDIINSSRTSIYNLRHTPARASAILRKISLVESLKVPKLSCDKRLRKSKSFTNIKKKSLSKSLIDNHPDRVESNTMDIHNLSHQDLGDYPRDGTVTEQVNWFRNLYCAELIFMETLNETWSAYIQNEERNEELTEGVVDDVRSAVGVLNLFKFGRFKQFGDLVKACEYKTGAKVVKPMDLMGFWEMIQNQVEEIRAKFITLDTRRNNHWEKLQTPISLKKMKANTKKKIGSGTKATKSKAKPAPKRIIEGPVEAEDKASKYNGTKIRIAEMRAKFRHESATVLTTEMEGSHTRPLKHPVPPPKHGHPTNSNGGGGKLDIFESETDPTDSRLRGHLDGDKENIIPGEFTFGDAIPQISEETGELPSKRRSQRHKQQHVPTNVRFDDMGSCPMGQMYGTPVRDDMTCVTRRASLAKFAKFFPEMSPIVRQDTLDLPPLPPHMSSTYSPRTQILRHKVSFSLPPTDEGDENDHSKVHKSFLCQSRRSSTILSALAPYLPPIIEVSSPQDSL